MYLKSSGKKRLYSLFVLAFAFAVANDPGALFVSAQNEDPNAVPVEDEMGLSDSDEVEDSSADAWLEEESIDQNEPEPMVEEGTGAEQAIVQDVQDRDEDSDATAAVEGSETDDPADPSVKLNAPADTSALPDDPWKDYDGYRTRT